MNFTDILSFLKLIDKNNNRDWFEKNKPKYLVAKLEFENFLGELHAELVKFDEKSGRYFVEKNDFTKIETGIILKNK